MRHIRTCAVAALCLGAAWPAAAADSGEAKIVRLQSKDYLVLGDGAVPGLKWEKVRKSEVPGVIRTSGLVNYDPRRVATIVSRVQGRIEDMRVSLWDGVAKGDPIVELYSPDFMTAQAEYLQASSTAAGTLDGMSAALMDASKQKLTLLGMSPQDLLDLKAPQATVWMRAPIGGTVVDAKVVRGSAVNPGDILFTLGTLDEVWITADVYEEDAPRLQVGQRLDAQVPAFPGETFRGAISNISPDINPDTHTLQVRSKVKNPDSRLKPRMLASVTISTRPGEILGVPQQAIIFDTDGYYAFIRGANGWVSRRKVETASGGEKGYVRLRSGLKAGEQVATAETIQLNALWHRAKGEGS